MPATVTLSSTTLALPIGELEPRLKLASTAGVTVGSRLYMDGELMTVVSLGVDPWVNVIRGADGTRARAHASAIAVYLGRGDQFYERDPIGRPPDAILVSPWINVRTGAVWFAQGDTLPPGQGDRWWQQQTTTHDVGALGVRTTTQDPTSST